MTPLCPVHGSARCPEDYMLKSNGKPWSDYSDIWNESMRCGRRPGVHGEWTHLDACDCCRENAEKIEDLMAEVDRLSVLLSDAAWLARLARSSSWPGEMAQRVEVAAALVIDGSNREVTQ